jgi:broad specificity phosphatase PhoE
VPLSELILVRHGQSTGNLARDRAVAERRDVIEVDQRDADVPLTPLGREQATGVATWLCGLEVERRPQLVWSSPYLRALETTQIALAGASFQREIAVDERLRDRELGILDRLTADGVAHQYPDEEARRRWLGKLYYRPPGGESWSDLALRLRSFLAELDRRPDDLRRAMLVCHDAVVLVLRYVCEAWDERTLLDVASRTALANASITRLVRTDAESPWSADLFNEVEHLDETGKPITRSEDDHAAHPH